jgi:hypothetical protein
VLVFDSYWQNTARAVKLQKILRRSKKLASPGVSLERILGNSFSAAAGNECPSPSAAALPWND